MTKRITNTEAWYLLEEAIATTGSKLPFLSEETVAKVNSQLVKFRDGYFAYDSGNAVPKDVWIPTGSVALDTIISKEKEKLVYLQTRLDTAKQGDDDWEEIPGKEN